MRRIIAICSLLFIGLATPLQAAEKSFVFLPGYETIPLMPELRVVKDSIETECNERGIVSTKIDAESFEATFRDILAFYKNKLGAWGWTGPFDSVYKNTKNKVYIFKRNDLYIGISPKKSYKNEDGIYMTKVGFNVSPLEGETNHHDCRSEEFSKSSKAIKEDIFNYLNEQKMQLRQNKAKDKIEDAVEAKKEKSK